MPELDDGKCMDCGGYGFFTAEPAFIYGAGKIKCQACNGTGMLLKPMKCEHCGHVKMPSGTAPEQGTATLAGVEERMVDSWTHRPCDPVIADLIEKVNIDGAVEELIRYAVAIGREDPKDAERWLKIQLILEDCLAQLENEPLEP